MSTNAQSGSTLFRGLLLTQLASTLIAALVVFLMAGVQAGLAALWGATICVIAHLWAGFQIWLHPRNHDPKHQAGAVIRAEAGKVLILLLLLWISLSRFPALRETGMALSLIAGLALTQVAGLVWLARATGSSGEDAGNES